MVAATGGSTNAGLHIPGDRARGRDPLHAGRRRRACSTRTPLIADLKPGGRFLAKDVHAIGGAPVVLRALLGAAGCLHGDA